MQYSGQIEDGQMHGRGRLQYPNGEIYDGDWVYGKLLVRAKLPAGKPGIWPAIWMMPTDQKYGSWPNSGEIDVMENVGWAPGVIHNSVHTGAFNHRLRSHKHAEVVVDDAHSAFHVYGVEWDEDSIKYSIDGQRTFEFVNTKSGNPAVESGVKINQ